MRWPALEKVWETLADLARAAADEYGLGVVLTVLIIGGLLWMLHRSYMARLADKDAEIQRLAGAYNELLKKVLKNPISSEPKKGGKK